MIVFVYGTLMHNQSNHQSYLKDQKYMGQAILSGYSLFDLGSFPGVIQEQGGKVLGELYEVDSQTLRKLDLLEGNGTLYPEVG